MEIARTGHDQKLCLQCRGITLESIFAPGGYYLYAHFDEVVQQAEKCIMCKVIRDGLRRNFVDRPCDDDGITALDRYLSLGEGPAADGPVLLRPGIGRDEASTDLRYVVLKVSISSEASCFLNWYPLFDISNNVLASPLRPVGIEKLHVARRWFEQSQSDWIAAGRVQHSKDDGLSDRVRFEQVFESHTPTRLIDLGESHRDPPDYVRLINPMTEHGSTSSSAQYVTLSHRWGSSQRLRTTKSNITNHRFGIKFLDLPQTFQDAAIVALVLGIRYLWIDALCIVQDDLIDWHREALLMGSIYKNSTCTIAVHNARDDDDGFLEVCLQPQSTVLLGRYGRGGEFRVSLRSSFKAEVDHSELSGRGWVLQERFLSPRTLHFTQESMFFEDFEGIKTEEDSATDTQARITGSSSGPAEVDRFSIAVPTYNPFIPKQPWLSANMPVDGNEIMLDTNRGFPGLQYKPLLERRTIAPFNISYRLQSGRLQDLLYQWFEIVERYSNTKLTFATDRLPAISGLARYIQSHTLEEYFCGTWACTFHIGLLWASDRYPVKRTTSSGAPSWSWASVEGPVQYPQYRDTIKQCARLLKVEHQGDLSFHAPASITLLAKLKCIQRLDSYDSNITDMFEDIIRRPPHVRRIVGYSVSKPVIWFSPEKTKDSQYQSPHNTNLVEIGWAAIDDKISEEECFYCALISTGTFDTSDNVNLVLILVPTRARFNEYRRVGMGIVGGVRGQSSHYQDFEQVSELDFFSGIEMTIFTIV